MHLKERLTRKEAAEYIGVTPATMANWASTGKVSIPFYKAGLKKVIYLRTDLDEFISSTKRMHA
ncbi:DNA-binding protein [Salmonella enterica subsp. houtenae]|nr:DNA-binding protein [Salmonella enterica subsp. houtenae]EAQ6167064.1 DNA-binding protein [Salmonella enterica]EAX4520391.1 helix-turn-helix domain-containing protein [Salmonella enterica]ECH9931744.1 DNA-binding protein [Salmonella enterica subsp. houtenae]ECZ5450566.1 helix-turn-helix domain-containing protein [Salmonella enterica subsp. houtenae]